MKEKVKNQIWRNLLVFLLAICFIPNLFSQEDGIPQPILLSIDKPDARPLDFLTSYHIAKGTWLEKPIPISEYTKEELEIQERSNQELLSKGFVITYSPIDDKYLFDDNNDIVPVEQRDIDNEPITPYTWKTIKFEMPELGGTILRADLRRPNWWIKYHKADEVGNLVHLTLDDVGVEGMAKVVSITPCPLDTRFFEMQKKDDDYANRPITGRFVRTTGETWDYLFENGDKIGCTPNHPFYSEDRQEYVPIGEIKVGECIKTYGDKKTSLVSMTRRQVEGEVETVYNLEVYRDHNYHVGKEGLLVHNSCAEIVKRVKKMTPVQRQNHINDGWDVVIKSSDDVPHFFAVRRYFQDLMEEFRYKVSGFTGTGEIADNFKAIDFYEELGSSGNIIDAGKVISMKTTKTNNVNTWKNYQSVKDNIQFLKTGLINNQGIEWNGTIIKYSKPEIHIYMPKDKFSSTVAAEWKTTLETLHSNIKFEITTLETYLK